MAKLHNSSPLLGKVLLTAKPLQTSEPLTLHLWLVLYLLLQLWSMLVFSLDWRVCAITRTQLALTFSSPRLSHDETFLYIDIYVCMYSCDDVAQSRKGMMLVNFAASFAKSSLSLTNRGADASLCWSLVVYNVSHNYCIA